MEWTLTADGKCGRMRDLFEAGCPIVFHSHLSSLYSNGTRAGLQAFEELVGRIERGVWRLGTMGEMQRAGEDVQVIAERRMQSAKRTICGGKNMEYQTISCCSHHGCT